MHMGCCSRHRMNLFRLTGYTDMRLHAKVPLDALLSLMHLGIPLFLSSFCRTGRMDDGRIHDGPSAHL